MGQPIALEQVRALCPASPQTPHRHYFRYRQRAIRFHFAPFFFLFFKIKSWASSLWNVPPNFICFFFLALRRLASATLTSSRVRTRSINIVIWCDKAWVPFASWSIPSKIFEHLPWWAEIQLLMKVDCATTNWWVNGICDSHSWEVQGREKRASGVPMWIDIQLRFKVTYLDLEALNQLLWIQISCCIVWMQRRTRTW